MRELAVYYCPKCGRYGYYQITRNAVCGQCDIKMLMLDMPYTNFIHLDPQERDTLLSTEILNQSTSISCRILASDRLHNEHRTVAALQSRITELEQDNQKLNDTIEWMHQTIWDLLAKSKALERRLETMQEEAHS